MDTISFAFENSESSGIPKPPAPLLVPDPDSEYGYKVEEMPESFGTTLTEEEFSEITGSYQAINNVALSNYLSFLLAFTASICLVYLLKRFLKPRLDRFKWAAHLFLAVLFLHYSSIGGGFGCRGALTIYSLLWK